MARRGLCSRREAARLIQAGAVQVDGHGITEPGRHVPLACEIRCGDLAHGPTVLLHKAIGITSPAAVDEITAARCVADVDQPLQAAALQQRGRLRVAGRLDAASSGLLVATADGRVARTLTAGSRIAKTYAVTLAGPVDDRLLHALRRIDRLDGEALLPMRIDRLAPDRLGFVLRQGRKHQIRRCCLQLGLRVLRLERERIGPWRLEGLQAGAWMAVDPAPLLRMEAGG